jgi:hypothetical protein
MLDQFCVTCHNQQLKTAGLLLDTADPQRHSGRRRNLGKGRDEATVRDECHRWDARSRIRRP